MDKRVIRTPNRQSKKSKNGLKMVRVAAFLQSTKKLSTRFCRDGKRRSSILVMNEDGIADRRGASDGTHFRGYFEKKHHVACSFLPMGCDATPSWNIQKSLARKASVPR